MAKTLINGHEQIKGNTVTDAEVNSSIIIASGLYPFTGTQSMGSNYLTNVLDPQNDQDAATKKYVDTQVGTVVSYGNLVVGETPTGDINGVNTTYTLANTPTASGVMLYLNGIYLQPGAGNDYTLAGNTITMLFAPATGDKLIAGFYYYS